MNPTQRDACRDRATNIIRDAIIAQSADQNRVATMVLVLDGIDAGSVDAGRLTRMFGIEPYRADMVMNLLADA